MSTIPLSRPQAAAYRNPDPVTLDLADIQSYVLYPVAFPFARFHFFHVPNAAAGRAFVRAVTPMVTNATHSGMPHEDRKASELTLSFTHDGLAAVGVPPRSLASFPLDFQQGMKARADEFLVDRGTSHPSGWEPIWDKGRIHILIGIQTTHIPGPTPGTLLVNGQEKLEELSKQVTEHARETGVSEIGRQDGGALTDDAGFSDKEHFGYSDGIGNPDIAGDGWPAPPGSGKPDGKGGWTPLAPGEFVLGVPDEAGEIPAAPVPVGLARNGSYMAYRKLHENVGQFRRWLAEEGERFAGGPELLAAKLVGRFRDGTPLEVSPHKAYGWTMKERMDPAHMPSLTDFTYGNDAEGSRCPMGAHIRRVNPRDSLGFNGVLVDRRRIIRRGVPYGEWVPETLSFEQMDEQDRVDADHESKHGVIFVAINASLERQFEFVQREWVNYGNDFRQGNDRDPLLGNREGEDRAVIQGDPHLETAPHMCTGLPQFVTTRGGEYFFIPGLSALRIIGSGSTETA
jgi:Dyp-type peroxidase family